MSKALLKQRRMVQKSKESFMFPLTSPCWSLVAFFGKGMYWETGWTETQTEGTATKEGYEIRPCLMK